MINGNRKNVCRGAVIAAALCGWAMPAMAQWTQWGGPNGDFSVAVTGLNTDWPKKGPEEIWSRDLGEDGYSGISVDDGVLYTMTRRGGKEFVVALDAKSGETRWEQGYDAPLPSGMSQQFGIGPRSTPLVVDGKVYTVGVSMLLQCLDKKTGKVIWSHHLTDEPNATPIFFGYSSSPMAYGDTIIVCVGGKGHSIMAFNQNSGTVVWKKHDFANSHSSPVLINVDGEDQVVVMMAKEVAGLDPKTGDLKWSHPHTNQVNINVTQPIWGSDNVLFISSGYGGGSRALKLTRSGDKTNVEELWHQRKMQVHFGNAIRVGNIIYGSTGDNGPVFFAAIDVKTGKMVFRKRATMAKAMFLWADEKLIALDEDGQLLIGQPKSNKKVRILSRAKVFDTLTWTVPTLVGTRMYLRDQKTIKALDLGKTSKPTT